MVKIAPSLLAANFANLQQEIQKVTQGGAHWLHYDVMDGHFVPNISFGYSILKDIKAITNLYLDVHLMISEPKKYVEEFIDAGASLVVFHLEAMKDEKATSELLQYIKSKGRDVGLSIKPTTPVELLTPFLSQLDVVLVMSVEPGFGGQKFDPDAVDKIKKLHTYRQVHGYHYLIEVDGGINATTANLCKEAGVDVLVAGSSVFNTEDYKKAIDSLL
jgi:ribulose-phosphate 3-epimerase